MPSYTPPLRDMHFVLHELLHVCDDFKQFPAHQELDQDTIAAVLEEGVDFSFVHSPLQWAGPFQGGIVGRYTPAKLLKDISVFFTLNEKKLGKFKKGHIFTINQYGSTERSVQKKNIGSFILSEITK